MLIKRASNDRGQADFGWLKARHSFSFGQYYDPHYMGFRSLRVINEDHVAAGAGFDEHGHKDMEIITVVLEGGVAHRDSTGGNGIIKPGDVQVMSAGSGVRHSEFNASHTDPLHLLQIWLMPAQQGVAPRYDQRHFDAASRQNKLQLVVSGNKNDDALFIHQDAKLYVATLEHGHSLTHTHDAGRFGWIQLAHGSMTVNGETMQAGDGMAFGEESTLRFNATADAQFLLFDLA